MNVLVFGASGYIGGHVARHLIASGHHVTGAARTETSAAKLRNEGMVAVLADMTDTFTLPALVGDHDAVIWAAQLMLEDEYRVTAALLDALAGSDRPLLFTSGTSLMSISTNGLWDERSFAEDEPFEPRRQIAPRLEVESMVRRRSASFHLPFSYVPSS